MFVTFFQQLARQMNLEKENFFSSGDKKCFVSVGRDETDSDRYLLFIGLKFTVKQLFCYLFIVKQLF